MTDWGRLLLQTYRIYFRHQRGGVVGREDFDAEDDRVALGFAVALCEACSDVCDSFELWQGVRLVGTTRGRDFPNADARLLSAKTQAAIVEREERLRDSKWAVARSRRLLERLQRHIEP
jgi:hypothetical protein